MRTNTPLQALILLNDPMVNEASRVFAESMLVKKYRPEEAVRLAFRSIVCREITRKELNRLRNFYALQEKALRTDSRRAKKILEQGEFPHPEGLDPAKTAALSLTILTMYNLEESITKS
jgi:Arc/MetJ family transcription regulator